MCGWGAVQRKRQMKTQDTLDRLLSVSSGNCYFQYLYHTFLSKRINVINVVGLFYYKVCQTCLRDALGSPWVPTLPHQSGEALGCNPLHTFLGKGHY